MSATKMDAKYIDLTEHFTFDANANVPAGYLDAKDASAIVAWGFRRREKGEKTPSQAKVIERVSVACAKLFQERWDLQDIADCIPGAFESNGYIRNTLTKNIVNSILSRAHWLESRLNFFKLENYLKRRALEKQLGEVEDAKYIDDINKKHAVVMLGGRCVVMTEGFDPIFNRPDISFSSITDFQNWYKNKIVPNPRPGRGRKEHVTIANAWLESSKRREYKGIIFDPCKKSNGYYNLWRGLAEKPVPGDWSLFYNHIRDVICSGNEESFKYLLHWMADAVQNPGGKRPGVSVVLKGKQGTGKGVFATQFGKLFGPHFLHIQSGQQFTGRFNGHLKNALFLFVDEAVWGGDKTAEGVLKGLVTEDLITIEHKFQDAIQIKNHLRILIASNNAWIVPAGMEERRFFTMEVSDSHMQDASYFKAIIDQMNSGGRAAMLNDLMQMDLFNVNLRKFPRTEALFDQSLRTMSNAKRFWYEFIQEPYDDGLWPEFINKDDFYSDYKAYCKSLGDTRPLIKDLFFKDLKGVCPDMTKGRITLVDENGKKTGKRKQVYYIPNQAKCRDLFTQACGGVDIPWGEIGKETEVIDYV